jgi:hypothetical protein
MATLDKTKIPSNWYQYDFPLKEIALEPKPSTANYDQKNCAWLIEFFAGILGYTKDQVVLNYENNTPKDRVDDIYVHHPNDKLYLPEKQNSKEKKSPELLNYEFKAKKSARLKLFQNNSPAKIKYFQ